MRIPRRADLTLEDLASWLNRIIAGWIDDYGRFYRTVMYPLLQRVNTYMRRLGAGNTSGCGPSSGSSGGGPACSNEHPACSPLGGWSARTPEGL
jgi:Group II intron, maturase-specific domain